MSRLSDPANSVVTLTASDTATFRATRGLYIGSAGALKFKTPEGDVITFANAVAGYHPIRAVMVYSTGSDAAVKNDIHALY